MGTCVYGWQIEAVYLIAGLLISSGGHSKNSQRQNQNIMNPDRKSMFPTAVLTIFKGLTNESQNIEILSTNSAYVAEVQLPKKCKVLFLNSGTHASKTKCKEFMVCPDKYVGNPDRAHKRGGQNISCTCLQCEPLLEPRKQGNFCYNSSWET